MAAASMRISVENELRDLEREMGLLTRRLNRPAGSFKANNAGARGGARDTPTRVTRPGRDRSPQRETTQRDTPGRRVVTLNRGRTLTIKKRVGSPGRERVVGRGMRSDDRRERGSRKSKDDTGIVITKTPAKIVRDGSDDDSDEKEEEKDSNEEAEKKEEGEEEAEEEGEEVGNKRKKPDSRGERRRPTDERLQKRHRRMFGGLLSHLGKASKMIKAAEQSNQGQKKKTQESKVESRLEQLHRENRAKADAYRQEARTKDAKLLAKLEKKKRKKQRDLLAAIKAEHEASMQHFILTRAQPPIYWLPREHTKATEKLLRDSRELALANAAESTLGEIEIDLAEEAAEKARRAAEKEKEKEKEGKKEGDEQEEEAEVEDAEAEAEAEAAEEEEKEEKNEAEEEPKEEEPKEEEPKEEEEE